ncbi:MAG: class I SAM-dependent rRNA methyltransferase [Polyangiaceae bacterium]
MVPVVTLKPGHIQPVWSGHPWVFAQAIGHIEGGALPGDEVRVVDPHGGFLGRGLYTPRSSIPVRIVTRDDVPIDGALIRKRIDRAIEARRDLGLPHTGGAHETTGYRLIHAEGDGLPGLMVDVFGDVVVVQLGTIGMKRREGLVLDALLHALSPRAILDRTSPSAAKMEGFEAGSGIVRGDTTVSELRFRERGLSYALPISLGQKTGFYFDQRTLRARVEQLAHGKRVLDTYSYVGSIAMAAARGGATEVLAVDESALALEVGAEQARQNGLDEKISMVRKDARRALGDASADGGYDLVICDPPKLAPTRGSRDGAAGAYRALASAGCRATRAGGVLVLCSCSSAMSMDDLTRALALGARDARAQAVVFDRCFQGADHPVPAAFPEGLYLKTLLARIEPV